MSSTPIALSKPLHRPFSTSQILPNYNGCIPMVNMVIESVDWVNAWGSLTCSYSNLLEKHFSKSIELWETEGTPVSYRVSPYTTVGAALALSTGLAWLACCTFRKRSNEEMWGSGLPTGQCIGIRECFFCIGLE